MRGEVVFAAHHLLNFMPCQNGGAVSRRKAARLGASRHIPRPVIALRLGADIGVDQPANGATSFLMKSAAACAKRRSDSSTAANNGSLIRSEERRVGKEGRSWW